MNPVRIEVDDRRHRMLVTLPVAASAFAEDGWLMVLARAVCGQDAVVEGRVSGRLGGMAFCASGEGDRWWKEIEKQKEQE